MPWDYAHRRRAERRYRVIFKTSAAAFIAGLLLAAFGVIGAVAAETTTLMGVGLLLASMGGLNAYKAVLSTMKILEMDAEELGTSFG